MVQTTNAQRQASQQRPQKWRKTKSPTTTNRSARPNEQKKFQNPKTKQIFNHRVVKTTNDKSTT